MKVIRNIKKIKTILSKARSEGRTIGIVPTMGALHQGHLSLIRRARHDNDLVVVSIFVNPVQFGPKEDFKKYPRDLKKDALACRKEGVDIIFYPPVKEMYPSGFRTYVEVEGLSTVLCGASRPGHFKGVATVVAKLFNIILPSRAYFGQKDAQQAIIIKKMSSDLNMPVEIKILPIVREKDGLAMSSRNVYLNKEERANAVILSQALAKAKKMFHSGKNSREVILAVSGMIKEKKGAKIDYICAVDPQGLGPVKNVKNSILLLLAVKFGKTRLIDNIII
ncbi:MAG: pantoate--beta-alanine ligase, partial [Candidatus Omnitrophica bacterium]|nr:pantoate--beta-alanine ligase [Candidatus Omnitrophota bacterium]